MRARLWRGVLAFGGALAQARSARAAAASLTTRLRRRAQCGQCRPSDGACAAALDAGSAAPLTLCLHGRARCVFMRGCNNLHSKARRKRQSSERLPIVRHCITRRSVVSWYVATTDDRIPPEGRTGFRAARGLP